MDIGKGVRVDESDVLALLKDLVSIKSVNPRYDGSSDEREIGDFVESFLKSNDIECEAQEVFPGRRNIIGRLAGSQPAKTLLFVAHLDTVTTQGMTIDPLSNPVDDGKVYGRGSCDTKGGMAAMLCVLKAIKASGVQPSANILVAATVDEEYKCGGAARLIEGGIRADGAVVAEPTELEIVVAHKGVLRWRVRTNGKAAHSSRVDLGVNAIVKMAKVIQAIEAKLVPQYKLRPHPLVGNPTINIGIIEGGIQANIVPDTCTVELDRRLVPGEDRELALREVAEVLETVGEGDPEFNATMEEPLVEALPLATREDERIVALAREASNRVLGKSRICGAPYTTEAGLLGRAGIPCVVLGPGSVDQAHTATEYVLIEKVIKAAELYLQIMLDF